MVCGYRKFQIQDVMGENLCTCTAHSGAKKAHDWVVEQLSDLVHSIHTTKTQHVTKRRDCGDFEVTAYLTRCLWCWISTSPTTVSEVALTLVLTDTYITLMISINH